MSSTVLRTTVTVMLTLVSLIHLMPLVGVLGAEQLTSLYLAEPNILILMRHRAILFGLLGVFILFAAFRQRYQLMALLAGYISVLGFLVLTYLSDDYNAALNRVVQADLVALVALTVASACRLMNRCRLKGLEH